MKPYIDFNTQLRTHATNDFEKDSFKLMNNAVFGKTMENIRKHKNIKLVTNREMYLHTVMKPNFMLGVLFGENVMGCKMGKIKVVMNKPVYLGQAILDLSKTVMYEFHYDYMVLRYGENLKLCYVDLMKDELGGAIMTEFEALRPKLYSFRKLDGAKDKKCKGINKCVVKKTLTFEDYKNCLFNPTNIYRLQLMFRSTKHEIHMIEINKVALNKDDDKWISKRDGLSTLARGHKSLSWTPWALWAWGRAATPYSGSYHLFNFYHL